MKMKKRISLIMATVLLIVTVLTGCEFTPGQYGSFWIGDVTMEVGDVVTLDKNFSNSSYANLDVTYEYDTNKITIANGEVLANAVGETFVTAKTKYHEIMFKVTVNEPETPVEPPAPVDYGTLWIGDINVEVGSSVNIEKEFSKSIYSSLAVNYQFSGNIITISGNTLTANAVGEIYVTASTTYHEAVFKVTVREVAQADYGTLSVANIVLNENETEQATAFFSKSEYSSLSVSYSTTDTDKITINGNQITGKKAGVATVTATTSFHTTTFTVTVNAFNYGDLVIDTVNVKTTETANINLQFTHAEYNTLPVTYVYDQSKITITGNTVTAKEATGTFPVTATTKYHTANFNVVVTAKSWGTLSVANLFVPYSETSDGTGFGSATEGGYYGEAMPVFSIPENAEPVTYEFDATKLRRDGNKFYPLSASKNTTVPVTAKTAHISTTFNIEVKTLANVNSTMANHEKNVKAKMVKFDADNTFNKNDMTIFIGDSYFDTNSFCKDFYTTRFPNQNVYTFNSGGSLAYHWQWFIQQVYKYNPKNLVLHMGINDANFGDKNDTDKVVTSLKNTLNELHRNLPNTKLYVYTVECIIDGGAFDADASYKFRDATQVIKVNTELRQYNQENDWFTILDSYNASHENPKKFFDNPASWDSTKVDETHPGTNGYNTMFSLCYDAGLYFSYKPGYTTAMANVDSNSFTTVSGSPTDISALVGNATKNYVFEAYIQLTSYTGTNGHVNFSIAGDSHRFLIWDNRGTSTFYYHAITTNYDAGGSGLTNGETNAQHGISKDNFINKGIKVAVLTTNRNSYLFVNDKLQCVFLNNKANSIYASETSTKSLKFGVYGMTAKITNSKCDSGALGYGLYASYVVRDDVQAYETSPVTGYNFVFDITK